jgi:DNA-binding NarL/FixJ family response regulator
LKRVLIVHADLLLSQGIESLLSREKDLVLRSVHIKILRSWDGLINRFNPNVIILDENVARRELYNLIALIRKSDEYKVIVVSVKKNRVFIYQKQESVVHGASDLVDVIRGEQGHLQLIY